MKFVCQSRHQRLKRWHRWFAWRPIRLYGECIWLEAVERRGQYCDYYGGWDWEYRILSTLASHDSKDTP